MKPPHLAVLTMPFVLFMPVAFAQETPGETAGGRLNPMVTAVSLVIEAAGVTIIVIGALVASGAFLYQLASRENFREAYRRYRAHLGWAILLGLEFLVAADIIGTVAVDPTFTNLGVLGLIVVIRTFLSFSLEVEISGHWPWRESEIKLKQGEKD